MLTYSRSGVTVFALSRSGVTLGRFFDSYYDRDDGTRGRRFFDGAWGRYGFEVWAGRRHLIVEFPRLAEALRRFLPPPPAHP